MNRWVPVVSLLLCACPEEVMLVSDSGQPDAGAPHDAGVDAGHPTRDAGVADAGFQNVLVADWCTDFGRVQCQRDARCGRIDDTLMASCLYAKSLACDSYAYTRSVTEGGLGFDSAAAARCLNDYGSGSCSTEPADCAGVFTGQTPALGACFVNEACDADAGYCDPYDFQCPHHCSGYVGLGETCDPYFSPTCHPGLACESQPDGGQPYFCVAAHGPLGEPCTLYSSCGAGYDCLSGACVKLTAALGEACDTYSDPTCDVESFCRQDLTATVPPPGICERRQGLGGVCFGQGTCLLSLRCTSSIGAGTCVPYAKLGAPCSNTDYYGNGECQDGLYCPLATSHCALLPTDGGDCSYQASANRCAAGYSCVYDFDTGAQSCQAMQADGMPCNDSSLCLSNECEYGFLPDGGIGGICTRCSHLADAGH